jgi:hypothetical protein
MRLFRENAIIFLGFILAVFPFMGIPAQWKNTAASGIGVLVCILALSVRRRVVLLKRKITSLYQRISGEV